MQNYETTSGHPLLKTSVGNAIIEKPHKFETLDGLRGVAALVIVTYHQKIWFPRGYLAVDLFFLLSGFVISFAYQQKLDGGLKATRFLKIRLIRLYPLYLLGLILGFIATNLFRPYHRVPFGHWGLMAMLCIGLFYIPIPPPRTHPHPAFPFNPPSWSLYLEIIANIFHAVLLRRRSTRSLVVWASICAPCLAASAAWHGNMDIGASTSDVLTGLFRVLFSYILGILLFRFWCSRKLRLKIPTAVPLILMTLVFAMPGLSSKTISVLYDIVCVFFILPLTVLLAASVEPERYAGTIFSFLGSISYAVYALHSGLLIFFSTAWRHSFGGWPSSPRWPLEPGIIGLLTVTVLATLVNVVFDIPVRRMLRERLGEKALRGLSSRSKTQDSSQPLALNSELTSQTE